MSDSSKADPFPTGHPNDVVLLSLLVFALTFVVARYGVGSPVGLVSVAVQVGVLVRINLLHRRLGKEAKA
jgi:hypothetical protein